MLKKVFRFLLLLVLALVVVGVITYLYLDKPKPIGTSGLEAEKLTDKILESINKAAYDSISYISFTFQDEHHYEWNKSSHTVTVKWDEFEVYLNLSRLPSSYNLLELKAYEYFINDSFWLVAPYKLRDEGVIRSTVQLKEGKGLRVEYTSGGVTPGDTYLWIIDENGFPKAWKIWTSNVPIGGVEFTWDGWVNMSGAWFATVHESKLIDVTISNLKTR
jgi:hypothetical protein